MPGIPATDLLFHYNALDLNGDGVVDTPASNSETASNWTDASVHQRAGTSEGTAPVRVSGQDVTTGVDFSQTSGTIVIPNANEINVQGGITARSFAFMFTTGSDISGTQIIYEQGGNVRGYQIAIAPDFLGRPSLVAFIWNEKEWAAGDHYRTINLGQVSADTTYSAAFVHDATAADLNSRTFTAYLDGQQAGTLNGIDVQEAHAGEIAIGGVNDNTVDPTSFQDLNAANTNDFEGSVQAVLSWGRALTVSEVDDVNTQLVSDFGISNQSDDGSGGSGSGSGDTGGGGGSTPPAQSENIIGNMPSDLAIFRFDSRDLDGNGLRDTGISGGESVGQWVDNAGYVHIARTQGSTDPALRITGNGDVAVDFSGTTNPLNIPNRDGINSAATYNQKSFAFAFETGSDVSGTQVIYEQGGGTRGYNLILDNGALYAYVWNNAEWDASHQYKSINLGAVQPDTSYSALFVHDATGASLADRTLSAYLDGELVQTITHVDVQRAHAGLVGLGGIDNVTLRPSNNAVIDGTAYNFKGSILQAASWNKALTAQERAAVVQEHGTGFGIDVAGTTVTTFDGTALNDDLIGTIGPEVINGFDGSDTIAAADGADTVNGGDGDDFLFAAEGDDTVDAGSGNDEIQGGDGNDTITAGIGDDTIGGGNDDDRILPGAGSDLIDGGAGTDTVVVPGNKADYTLSSIGNGFFTLEETSTGDTDTILGAENIEYADQTEALAVIAPSTPDFDGATDLLWSTPATGFVFAARDGDVRDTFGLGIHATREFIGTGDFDGDSVDDILFRYTNNDYTFYAPGGDTSQNTGLGVQSGRDVLAIGDFTGDGRDDVLFKETSTGYTFLLDDADPTKTIGLGNQATRELLAIGNFDSNNAVDMLFRDTGTGYTFILTDGTTAGQRGLGDQSNRDLVAVVDVDGNNIDDLVLQDRTTGYTFVALGGDVTNTIGLGVKTGHVLEGAGDLDGDGGADLIWRKSDNDYLYWHDGNAPASVNGLGIQAGRELLAVTDLTGDGGDDIVLRDTTTGYTFYSDNGDVAALTGLGIHQGEELLRVFDAGEDGATELLFRDTGTGYTFFISNGDIAQVTGVGVQSGVDLLGVPSPEGLGLDTGSFLFS